jgi:predicted Fe-Mo cluster-binding NifX family protein
MEKIMKIAIVTDDHLTISTHFGRAKFYEVFTIEGGHVTAQETIARSNPQLLPTVVSDSAPGGHHHHNHDHNAMIAPIADCKALVTRGMGMGAHVSLQEHGIQPIITDLPEIQDAVKAFIDGVLVDHVERLH